MSDERRICCEVMAAQLRWSCDRHELPEECPDCLVWYYPRSSAFGLPVHDGGSSFMHIKYCPWCGADLAAFTPPEVGRVPGSKAAWSCLRVKGLGPVERVAGMFQIGPPLQWLPFPSFKVKVLERGDGSFLGVPNVSVKGPDGSPQWTSGLGSTVEQALEDALNYFVKSLDDRRDWPETAFTWTDSEEF